MRAYVIVPPGGCRNVGLLSSLGEMTELEVVIVPAVMLDSYPEHYDLVRSRALHDVELLPSEVGCATSHRAVWKSVAGSSDPWALVFEDDAYLLDPSELSTAIDQVRLHLSSSDDFVVSLFTGDAVILDWVGDSLGRSWTEPAGNVAYFISSGAAGRLARANESLGFRSDWPRDSGVSFYVYGKALIGHDLRMSRSLIGEERSTDDQKPMSKSNISFRLIVNRLKLYTFVHYLRYRSYFDGPRQYYRMVLRHRFAHHFGHRILKRRRLREGVFFVRPKPSPDRA